MKENKIMNKNKIIYQNNALGVKYELAIMESDLEDDEIVINFEEYEHLRKYAKELKLREIKKWLKTLTKEQLDSFLK